MYKQIYYTATIDVIVTTITIIIIIALLIAVMQLRRKSVISVNSL